MGRLVKTHTINGKKYNILIGDFDGIAHSSETNGCLVVNADLNTRKGLITLFHEILHLSGWDKHEETIDRVAQEGGSLVWRLGYRTKWKLE